MKCILLDIHKRTATPFLGHYYSATVASIFVQIGVCNPQRASYFTYPSVLTEAKSELNIWANSGKKNAMER